ncbi:hypothetical protein POTOM_037926 [Populus tomentosa]|uniref:Vacuolar iron transporter n=1 Tax=Populus tomentosa TaxID=118781 RepID=A0A8X7YVT1_POPTO|nr:hypothetical protein POTOM_037926 [Populus tomentosa]
MSGRVAGTGVLTRGTPLTLIDSPLLGQPFVIPYRCVSDGLTVPFALAAGLSGATVTSSIILVAGIPEVAAGAISMGLGGYLAAESEADHKLRELKSVAGHTWFA